MKTRIRNRFMRLFVALSLGPLAAISAAMLWRAYTLQTARAIDFLRHDLADCGRLVTSLAEERVWALSACGRAAIDLKSSEEQHRLLEDCIAENKAFDDIVLTDANGHELARTGDGSVSLPPAQADRLRAREPYVFLADDPPRERLCTVIPIIRGNAVGGILVAAMRIDRLWERLPSVHLEHAQHFYLLDTSGRLLAGMAQPNDWGSASIPAQDGYRTGIRGTSVIAASSPVTFLNQPLVILAERDASDALMPFYATARGLAVLTFSVVCCAIGVGVWTVRRLTRPVQDLRDAARAIEAGELTRQAPVRHADEVGELADAFNRMTARVRNSLGLLQGEVEQHARTEEHLKRSLAMLRAMFDASLDAVVVVSDDGTVVNWNKHFAAMWYLPEEAPSASSTAELWKHIAARLAHPDPFLDSRDTVTDTDTYETALLDTRDGRIIEEYSRPNVMDGRVIGHVWCFRDVTETTRHERDLRASEERFRTIFESAHDGIFLKNRDLRYTHVNPAMERMFGVPASTLIGHTGDSIFGAEGGTVIDEVDRRVLAGEVVELEDTRPLASGERTFHVIKVPMRNQGGEIIGLCGITRDVTARKAAEIALRESERRYRLLAENVIDVIWTMDLNLRFTYMSPSVTHMQGYTVEEAMGRRIADYLSASSLMNVQQAVRAEFELERSGANPRRARVLELEQRCKNGQNVWTEVTVSFLRDDTGTPAGIVGVTRDISRRKKDEADRKRLEAQMQHTQKLESLGVLAGGIAHDFNNLLMGILGYAGLAMRELPPDSATRLRIQQIEQAGQRAADLAKQLLAYSGRGKFVIEPIDLGRLVEEMAHFLEASISKKAVLRYNFASGLPSVEADATQVRQIVMNLITNASDALGDDIGVISISTGVMEADHDYLAQTYLDDSLEGGLYVYLEVADTGCGMDDETKTRIFDPFFTTKFVGRGLGLAATLGIVRGHRGAVKVTSERGTGTTFKILLPASRQDLQVLTDEADARPWHGSGTILVVDDEAIVRDVAMRTLTPLGFQVLQAADGQEGVDVFEKHSGEIVLVLLDMTMPRLSGEQTYERLRQIRADTRVLLSSGYNEQETSRRFAGQGVGGFIQKPYHPQDLIAKVQRILQEDVTG